MLTVLDLFSGIGGFSLGLERAGMRTISFCEIDPFCRAVLANHWPKVRCHQDVRELSAQHLTADGFAPDVICGGFPCQDISIAGEGAGLAGERSGLWREFARLISEIRPRYIIVENVAALLGRGLGDVLGDLAALGYDAEWDCFPSALTRGHRRERIWIVAYDSSSRLSQRSHANAVSPDEARIFTGQRFASVLASAVPASLWSDRPLLGRGIHGIPNRTHRIAALGNAVVPQIPEIIGRAILAAEQTVHQ